MTAAKEPRFGRMIPAMVTPFDENLELNLDQVRALARRLVDAACFVHKPKAADISCVHKNAPLP